MARTVSVQALQDMQRESHDGAANGRGPGFQAPAVPVADQLRALVLADDISGMPLGQVVGLVRLAVAAAHVNATETEIRDEAERRFLASHPGDDPVEQEAEERAEDATVSETCPHTYVGAGTCALCGEPVEPKPEARDPDFIDGLAEAMADGRVGEIAVRPSDGINEPIVPDLIRALGIEAQCTAEMSLHMITERVREAVNRVFPEATEAEIVHEAERILEGFTDNRKGPRVATVAPDGIVESIRPAEMTPDRGPDVGTTVHQVNDDEPRFSGAGASDRKEPSKLIPSDADFKGRPFVESIQLAQLASDLIEKRGYLEHLEHCEIRYWWQRKTGTVDRERVLSSMKRGSGHYGELLGAEFAIFLAADTARDRNHTDRHVERSLLRQLRRIGQDDKGNWIKLPFTLKLDVEDIQEYADLDDVDLKLVRKAHRNAEQMGLFATNDEDDFDDEDEREDAARAGYVETPDGAGTLIHQDGTPMTQAEIEAMERRELADDDGLDTGMEGDGAFDEDPDELQENRPRDPFMAAGSDSGGSAEREETEPDILADPAVI